MGGGGVPEQVGCLPQGSGLGQHPVALVDLRRPYGLSLLPLFSPHPISQACPLAPGYLLALTATQRSPSLNPALSTACVWQEESLLKGCDAAPWGTPSRAGSLVTQAGGGADPVQVQAVGVGLAVAQASHPGKAACL